jgi:small subunit ribosomal protein S2
MELASVKELIQAGAHLGHTVSRWNPRMKQFIFGKQNKTHIIDIKHTLKGMVIAQHYLAEIAKKNGIVLFVGTKQQIKAMVKDEATRCNMPYVSERWLGGTLTNFNTIRSRLSKLIELETMEKDGSLSRYNKKEISMFNRELSKLKRNLSGIKSMARLPDAMIAVDYKDSKIPIREAKAMKIRTIGLIDTDGDPTGVDIVIPINDDGMRAINLVLKQMADAIIEGHTHAKTVKVTPLEKEKPKKTKEEK